MAVFNLTTPDELASTKITLENRISLIEDRVSKLELLSAPPSPIPVPLPIPVSGFSVPDLLNNASFEIGWDGFIDWSYGIPGPTNFNGFSCVRSQEHAKDGLWSVKSSFAPNGSDNHIEFAYPFG